VRFAVFKKDLQTAIVCQMIPHLDFRKLSGSGNDFVCIDNRDGRLDAITSDRARVAEFAQILCDRHTGIGADGMVLAMPMEIPDVADVAAAFYEPDGSVAELCGNGTGCFVRCALVSGWAQGPEVRILTSAGIVLGQAVDGDYVRVCIPLPEQQQTDLPVSLDGQAPLICDFAVTGVPHLMVYVDSAEDADVAHVGAALRNHPQFAPRGVNANFVEVLGPGKLAVRTWEFGVEGETLACGTGAAAAAVMAIRKFGWDGSLRNGQQPVLVTAGGGDVLRVFCSFSGDRITDLCVDTTVKEVFRGRLHPNFLDRALARES